MSGSVRGALGDECPYRDFRLRADQGLAEWVPSIWIAAHCLRLEDVVPSQSVASPVDHATFFPDFNNMGGAGPAIVEVRVKRTRLDLRIFLRD